MFYNENGLISLNHNLLYWPAGVLSPNLGLKIYYTD